MANIDFKDKEALLKHFDVMATPFFEVIGELKKRKFQHTIDDIDEARNLLATNLEAIKICESTTVYTIIYYSEVNEKGRLVQDSMIGSNTFKLTYSEEWKKLSMPSSEINEIKEMLIAQQSQLNALMMEPDEDPEDETDKIGNAGGLIGALTSIFVPILSHPEVQQAIATKAIGFLNSILPDKKVNTMQMNNNTALAGLTQPDLESINKSCEILLSAGMTATDFEKLAALASDPGQFAFYLSMLRK